MTRYFCFICPFCGHAQAKLSLDVSTSVFKCNMCEKTRKVKYKNQLGLQLKGTEVKDMTTAVSKAMDINSKNQDLSVKFDSYGGKDGN